MATADPTSAPATQSVVVQPSTPAPLALSAGVQMVGEWAGAAIAVAGVVAIATRTLDRVISRAVDALRRDVTSTNAKISDNAGDIRAIQAKVADFMPRAEIEQRDGEVKRIAEKACDQAGDLREAHGRLDTRVDGLASELRDQSIMMRDRFDRLDAKVDRIIEISAKRG